MGGRIKIVNIKILDGEGAPGLLACWHVQFMQHPQIDVYTCIRVVETTDQSENDSCEWQGLGRMRGVVLLSDSVMNGRMDGPQCFGHDSALTFPPIVMRSIMLASERG